MPMVDPAFIQDLRRKHHLEEGVDGSTSCAVGLVLSEGSCEIKEVVAGLQEGCSLRNGNVIIQVDGKVVDGSSVAKQLSFGEVGSIVKVLAHCSKTNNNIVEVNLKRRNASIGENFCNSSKLIRTNSTDSAVKHVAGLRSSLRNASQVKNGLSTALLEPVTSNLDQLVQVWDQQDEKICSRIQSMRGYIEELENEMLRKAKIDVADAGTVTVRSNEPGEEISPIRQERALAGDTDHVSLAMNQQIAEMQSHLEHAQKQLQQRDLEIARIRNVNESLTRDCEVLFDLHQGNFTESARLKLSLLELKEKMPSYVVEVMFCQNQVKEIEEQMELISKRCSDGLSKIGSQSASLHQCIRDVHSENKLVKEEKKAQEETHNKLQQIWHVFHNQYSDDMEGVVHSVSQVEEVLNHTKIDLQRLWNEVEAKDRKTQAEVQGLENEILGLRQRIDVLEQTEHNSQIKHTSQRKEMSKLLQTALEKVDEATIRGREIEVEKNMAVQRFIKAKRFLTDFVDVITFVEHAIADLVCVVKEGFDELSSWKYLSEQNANRRRELEDRIAALQRELNSANLWSSNRDIELVAAKAEICRLAQQVVYLEAEVSAMRRQREEARFDMQQCQNSCKSAVANLESIKNDLSSRNNDFLSSNSLVSELSKVKAQLQSGMAIRRDDELKGLSCRVFARAVELMPAFPCPFEASNPTGEHELVEQAVPCPYAESDAEMESGSFSPVINRSKNPSPTSTDRKKQSIQQDAKDVTSTAKTSGKPEWISGLLNYFHSG